MNTETAHTDNSIEIQLIVGCSQTCISPIEAERISRALNQPLNWDYILTVAGRNGLLPIVSWNLLQKFCDFLPEAINKQLSQFFRNHTKNNLFLTSKLIEIVKMLDAADIPVLPFKGTTLALQAYNNLALRQYSDLDILVKPKHFKAATRILSENGYASDGEANWLRRKILFFTNKKDIVLNGSENRVQIELHWKLSGSHFSLPLEISQLWSRLERLNLGGVKINALPFNDLFVYLCLHGSRHEWERLSWICDLRELIRTFENSPKKIDWREVQRHAKSHGCERVVQLGLFLVQDFFDVKTDYLGYEEIERNEEFSKITGRVRKRVFSATIAPSLKRDKYSYLLYLKEKRTHRVNLYLVYLTFYLKILFTPNAVDKSIFRLPKVIFPLYYILRVTRLFFTYFNSNQMKKIFLKKEKDL